MQELGSKLLDPRVRRTRALLHDALFELLRSRSFEDISLQDIAETATLNRATVYAHCDDKYALLANATTAKFNRLIEHRNVTFDGSCASAIRRIFVAVCDYIESVGTCDRDRMRPIDPHMAAAIVDTVRDVMSAGLSKRSGDAALPTDIVAAAAASAIYGAARAWLALPERGSAEDVADAVTALVWPVVDPTPNAAFKSTAAS